MVCGISLGNCFWCGFYHTLLDLYGYVYIIKDMLTAMKPVRLQAVSEWYHSDPRTLILTIAPDTRDETAGVNRNFPCGFTAQDGRSHSSAVSNTELFQTLGPPGVNYCVPR